MRVVAKLAASPNSSAVDNSRSRCVAVLISLDDDSGMKLAQSARHRTGANVLQVLLSSNCFPSVSRRSPSAPDHYR